jgi:hypothetical protein
MNLPSLKLYEMDAPKSSLQVIAIAICLVSGAVSILIFVCIQTPKSIATKNVDIESDNGKTIKSNRDNQSSVRTNKRTDISSSNNRNNKSSEPKDANKINTWKCVCEGGGIFLPPSLMKNLGGPGAALRLGTGKCYHKQT